MKIEEIKKDHNIYTDSISSIDKDAIEQFMNCMNQPSVVKGAMLPDAHSGFTLNIGGAIATKNTLFPSWVGFDIGCSVLAWKLNIKKEDVNLEKLKEHIIENVPVGFNKHQEPRFSPPDTNNVSNFLLKVLTNKGLHQLGTLGGGNHYLELSEDVSDGLLWINIHSGSRGLGHSIANHYMAVAMRENTDISELENDFAIGKEEFIQHNYKRYLLARDKYVTKALEKRNIEGSYPLNFNSESGQAYYNDMLYCIEYAKVNKQSMASEVIQGLEEQGLSIEISLKIDENHNHALYDEKTELIIHRKGATHSGKDQYGVIPANMVDGAFIVKGKGNPDSLESSSHGAGRVLSRTKARKQLNQKEFENSIKDVVTNHNGVDTLDEAPKAYKDIYKVMELQKDLVEVITQIKPILNIKG